MKKLNFIFIVIFTVMIGCSGDDSSSVPAKEIATVTVLADVLTISAVAEVTDITCPANSSASLNGKYWLLNSPTTEYYVWYNTGGSTNPNILGKTGIMVSSLSDLDSTQAATATSGVIDVVADFNSGSALAVVTITNAATGAVVDITDGDAGISSITVTTQGVSGVTANSLSGEYFTINSSETNYYVWFDVDDGSINPNVAEKIAVEIDITAGESAANVAAKVQTAVDGLTGLSATVSGDIVTITSDAEGDLDDATAGNSGFTVNITTQGN